jgi:hypothetical protein
MDAAEEVEALSPPRDESMLHAGHLVSKGFVL